MNIKRPHPSFISRYSFFFGSSQTALSLFWPAEMDMDEVIRKNMAQALQIWKKKKNKNGKKIRTYKNSKSKGKSMFIIIILHLYNLGIMVGESIYKI